MKVEIKCDYNSTKKQFLLDYNMAFFDENLDFLKAHSASDIQWNIIGNEMIIGSDALCTAVKGMSEFPPQSLVIHQIITHGKEAVLLGEMIMDADKKYEFCDAYEFVSAGKQVIKKIKSFIIKVQEP